MLTITNEQLDAIGQAEKKKLIDQATVFFKEKFTVGQLNLMNMPVEEFAGKYFDKAIELKIYAQSAIVKFILLNFVKGADFIEQPANKFLKLDLRTAREEAKEKLLDNFFRKAEPQ